jgi:hypothetical protein
MDWAFSDAVMALAPHRVHLLERIGEVQLQEWHLLKIWLTTSTMSLWPASVSQTEILFLDRRIEDGS